MIHSLAERGLAGYLRVVVLERLSTRPHSTIQRQGALSESRQSCVLKPALNLVLLKPALILVLLVLALVVMPSGLAFAHPPAPIDDQVPRQERTDPVQSSVTSLDSSYTLYLPATLKRGAFHTFVADRPGVSSSQEWRKWGFTPTSETVIGTVTASPNDDRLLGVIGFFNGESGSMGQAAVQVRFNPDGEFDALDGASYRAVTRRRYELGAAYDFRIVVNVPQQSFDAWVTPVDEVPVLVARDFAFNPSAAPSDQVSHLGIYSEEGSFQALQFTREFHAAYERVTPKTAYGWFPGAPDADAVVNVSPTPGEGWYGTADIHPDGTDMIFHGAAWGYARIWRYTFATREMTPLTPPTFVAVEPAYSADGDSIVFTSDKNVGGPRFDMHEVGRTRPDEDGFKGGYTGAANLFVMDADGQNLRQITSGDGHVDKRGSFSPDGETVVFLSSRGANTLYMWTVPSDGSMPPTKVEMVDSPWVGRPRYSVDGREIFFFTGIEDGAYDPYGRHTLCRVPVGGGAWSTIPNDRVGNGSHGPAPSPDGEYLWYHAINDDLWGVYKLPLAGGDPIRFVPPGFDFLHIAHATEASNGSVAFDSRSYLETP